VSLRRRLVLLVTGTVGVVLLVAALSTYAAMRAGLRDQVDDTLREQVQTMRGAADAPGLRGPRRGRDLPPGAIRARPPRLGEAAGVVQVVGADGSVRLAPEEDVVLPVTKADAEVAAGTREDLISDRTVDGEHLRVLTAQLGDRPVAVQLARSFESADSTLGRLRMILALLVVLATAVALAVSRLVAQKVVAPVTELTEAAEHISATDDLGRRIEATGEDEVGRMADRFNAMLDRLQGSRDAVAASAAAQRQLVADASHELRTPVTSLRTNIEVLLAGGAPGEDERRRVLEDVRDQAEELSALITDVIELARGDQPLGDGAEDVRVDEVVAEMIERARRDAPQVTFTAELEAETIVGAGDRLGRAVGNLLVNAAGHSDPGDTVEVRLRGGVLEVRDHGPGVDDADKPHVFDRFYRGATARSRPGSGLGLAIVRQAAEAHGGTVEVADADGGGAIFRLRLPTTPAGRPDSAAAPRPAG
jgi:two-component system sensor histidine kinase MprB